MDFKIQESGQSLNLLYYFEKALFGKCLELSQKTRLIRLAAPVIGVADGIATLASGVMNAGEDIIKGLGNILGSPVSRKCSFKAGCTQLFIDLPIVTALSILACSYKMVEATYKMATSPIAFSHLKYNYALQELKD